MLLLNSTACPRLERNQRTSRPARRWLVVLEYANDFDVESTHDARDDALKQAKELAAEHKVSFVERP
jgi:hypothetical protein